MAKGFNIDPSNLIKYRKDFEFILIKVFGYKGFF